MVDLNINYYLLNSNFKPEISMCQCYVFSHRDPHFHECIRYPCKINLIICERKFYCVYITSNKELVRKSFIWHFFVNYSSVLAELHSNKQAFAHGIIDHNPLPWEILLGKGVWDWCAVIASESRLTRFQTGICDGTTHTLIHDLSQLLTECT